jgi:AraC-like DNA-binding protein
VHGRLIAFDAQPHRRIGVRHHCLAVVPSERASRLRDLDPANYQWEFAATWTDAMDAIRARPIDLGILDPLIEGESGIAQVEDLRARFPSLPLVLYTNLSPAAAAVLLRLGRVGIRRVIFTRFEDSPGNLRRTLSKELEHAAIQQVMRSLETLLQGLPDTLRRALEVSLHAPGDRMNLALLAEHACLSRYECQEWFARARLPVPRVVMALIRLLYAHRLLLDPGHTIENVAQKLGYAKTRTLQTQLRMVFGMTAGELREALSPADAVETLQRRYFTLYPPEIAEQRLMAAPGR